MMDEIKPEDTREIVEAVPSLERIKESKARDLKYREMAIRAALSSDIRLADEIISKIEDEAIRGDTTMRVFSPYVRKAVAQSDWTGAREYAARIVDPIGRTLVLDHIAQGMYRSNKDKQSVKDIYSFALYRLRRESPTEEVAKAFLVLAKSLSTLDADESFHSVSWAVYILNKLTRNGELPGESKVGDALALWVTKSIFSLHDEGMDLTEMIGPLFREMVKRDPDTAMTVAYGFAHQGLYSFAQLGVIRGLLDDPRYPKASTEPLRKPGPGQN
jgi:hypothetical protein